MNQQDGRTVMNWIGNMRLSHFTFTDANKHFPWCDVNIFTVVRVIFSYSYVQLKPFLKTRSPMLCSNYRSSKCECWNCNQRKHTIRIK